MKVIEQLVDHLSSSGMLDGEAVEWLRKEGFLPSQDELRQEIVAEEPAPFQLEAEPFEKIEEELIAKGGAAKEKFFPTIWPKGKGEKQRSAVESQDAKITGDP